jgi:hypothetical protein
MRPSEAIADRPVAIPQKTQRLGRQSADSDDLARVYRFDLAQDSEDDLAHHSDLISPGARGVLAIWFLALAKPRGQS